MNEEEQAVITLKKELQETVEELKKDGYDLSETPAIFRWTYPEDPHIEYQLLIRGTKQGSFSFIEDTPLH